VRPAPAAHNVHVIETDPEGEAAAGEKPSA
jgi:hypothetical protein